MCSQANLDRIRQVIETKVEEKQVFTAFDVTLEVQKLARNDGETPELHAQIKNTIHRELQKHVDSGLYTKHLWDVGAPVRAFLYRPPAVAPATYTARRRTTAVARDPSATVLPKVFSQGRAIATEGGTLSSVFKQLTRATTPTVTTPVTASTTSLPDIFKQKPVTRLPEIFKQKPVTRASLTIALREAATQIAAQKTGRTQNKHNSTDNRTTDKRGTLSIPANLVRECGLQPGDKVYVYADRMNGPIALLAKDPFTFEGANLITTYTVDSYFNVRVTQKALRACGLPQSEGYFLELNADRNKIFVSVEPNKVFVTA